MFVRMDNKPDINEIKYNLSVMAENLFDFNHAFGDASITYMLLEHARDDMLAALEILELPEYL